MNRTRMLVCTLALAALAFLTTSVAGPATPADPNGSTLEADRWCC